jgi:hypothetical protein
MTDFADLLESRLAGKGPEIRQACRREDERRRAEAMRFEQVRAEAGDLLSGDLRPLLEDFLAVMQSPKRSENQSLLREGRIRVERPASGRPRADKLMLALKALGPARARRYYEVRVTATAAADGRGLALAAECIHYLPPSPRRESAEETLVALPALAFQAEMAVELGRTGPHPWAVCFWKGDDVPPTGAWDYETWKRSARQWLGDVLQQSAEAIIAASFHNAPPAPLMTFPALAAGACPVMT